MNDIVLLNLVCPKPLEEQVTSLLLEHPEVVAGFSTHDGDGHGSGAPLYDREEHVRGRARRVSVQMILPQAQVEQVLALVRGEFGAIGLYYWVVPVLMSGRVE